MSTLKVNSIAPANPGSETYFLTRAWVNFDGRSTVTIRQDGNVSSITDNGTGNYTVNYSSPMTDVDYSASGACNQLGNPADSSVVNIAGTNNAVALYATSGTAILTTWPSVGVADAEYAFFKVTR